jgi:hypothetical protein
MHLFLIARYRRDHPIARDIGDLSFPDDILCRLRVSLRKSLFG